MDNGDKVQVRFTKWGGGPHWTLSCRLLGTDDAGTWVGLAAGDPMRRPGHDIRLQYGRVLVLGGPDRGFVASFNEWIDGPDCAHTSTYVDITTPAVWGASSDATPQVTMDDLDLDVVQRWTGEIEVADEDEFAEHRRTLGYPDELVAHARHWRDEVLRLLESGLGPFDGREARWIDELTAMTRPEALD